MILNVVWLALFFAAGLFGLVRMLDGSDPLAFAAMSTALFDSAKTAFTLVLNLAGTLIFWMGVLKVAEKAGAIRLMSRAVAPILRRVFPGLPPDHPAAGAMVMNFAANALNLDNAATPAGLRAMQELQKLNNDSPTASNHQVLFMVMHAASLTLIPVSILSVRAAGGASNPADVFLPLLLASACSALGGFLAVALVQRLRLWDPVLLLFLAGVVALIGGTAWGLSRLPSAQVETLSSQISGVALFAAIFWFLALAVVNRINAWEAFLEGAKDGFDTAIQIAPYLIGILVAVGVFRASGGLDYVVAGVWHLIAWTGLPQEASGAIPTMLMKPLAGGASRGLMVDAMKAYGPDSFTARLAGIFQGSTDTTLYVIALYSGAARLKNLRHTLPCALVADLAGWIGAIVMAIVFFG